MDLEIVMFEPGGRPSDERTGQTKGVPKMTAGQAALAGLMDRYTRALLDPFVTLQDVHRLLYFMQASGEPLGLRYRKAAYGPYAENLRHVLNETGGLFISGYADGGSSPGKQVELVAGAVGDAELFLKDHPETRARFDRVAELVEGFESSFGLELLATVHRVAAEDPTASTEDVVAGTYAWDERKRQFSEGQIRLALGVLREKGWLAGYPAAIS